MGLTYPQPTMEFHHDIIHDLHNEPFEGYEIVESVLHWSAMRLDSYVHRVT